MAEDKTAFIDNSKINPYGLEENQLKDYQKSVQGQLDALEQRYAQPNWFKVSAGFLKPQLGGFGASLGSAFGAMGESVEQQRAQALPIAQMRAQLAQSDILLNQNKEASDKVKAFYADPANKGKKLPPAGAIGELAAGAPNAPAVQSLLTQQKIAQDQYATESNNLKHLYETGAINKQEYARRLSALNPFESSTQGAVVDVNKPETSVKTLPSGARVNEDQARLADLGIPIISGFRTKDEQQALYDNREKNPYPVAAPGTSQHEMGNAIDVDTKKLTPEQRRMLKDLGYTQPMPDKDPNHWEKSGARGERSVPSFEELGATGSGASELTKEQLKAITEKYGPLEQRIISYDPQSISTAHSRHDRLVELLGTSGVQKGTGLLYKDQGITTAILSSLAQGASASINTPAGGAGFSLAFPVENAMTKTRLKPFEQKQLREFQMLLRDEASDDLRKGVLSIGGGHLNQAEFSSVMNQIASGSDPYGILKGLVATRSTINERNGEEFDLYGDWIHNPKNAGKPVSVFFHSKPYKDLMKKYEPKIKQAKRLAD